MVKTCQAGKTSHISDKKSALTGVSPIITIALSEYRLRPTTVFLKEGKEEIITNL
jgi:hypothetical protein